jgi:menaquinone-9 beta-reductase
VNKMFDLAVIGAGPAGSSAAITARRLGFDVLLLEAGSFPRHKVCGEFVSAEALDLLSNLLPSSLLLRDSQRVAKARIFVDGSHAEFPIIPAAASLTRFDLDLALWQAASGAGCSALSGMRVKDVQTGNRFVLAAGNQQVSARAVINASGRWSNLGAHQSAGAEQWIGVKEHFYETDAPNSCDLYFFEGGYCGVQPLGNGLVNAAAMVKPEVARNLSDVLALNSELERRAQRWTSAMPAVSTAPLFFRAPETSRKNMLLVGDAAAFLDPFAGDGISIALHSGRLAALALAPYLRGESPLQASIETYDRCYRQLIQPALSSARRLRRLIRMPRILRSTAVSLLNVPAIGRAAVSSTRVRKAS